MVHDGSQRLVSARKLPQPLQGSVRFFEQDEAGPRANADQYTVEVVFGKELLTAPLKQYVAGVTIILGVFLMALSQANRRN